jgi:polysaccharide biosynthesis transport protein
MATYPTAEPTLPSADWNVRDYLDILWRRKAVFIQVFLIMLAMGIAAAMRSKPIYQTYAKLLVAASAPNVNLVDANNPIAQLLAAARPDSVETQLQVLQSAPFLDEAYRVARIVPNPDVIPPSVRAEVVENTSVIQITVQGGDPRQIADLANAVVDLHRQRTDLLATTGLRETMQFVAKEKDKAAKSLAQADRELLRFRQVHRGVGLDSEKEAKTGEYAALLARVIELESNVTTTRTQLADLRSRVAKEPRELVEETTRDNPGVARLQDKLAELQIQQMEMRRDYRPASRAMQDMEGQIADFKLRLAAEPKEIRARTHSPNPTRALLQSRLEEQEASLRGFEENLSAARAQYQAKKGLLDSLAPWESELSRLNRDRDAIQASYTFLSERLRDLEIRKGAQLPMARTIERAGVPTAPVQPYRGKNIALSAFLALVLAIGTVFLQEFLDDRVNGAEEAERLCSLPTLAYVPLIEAEQPRLLSSHPTNSPVVEAYRSLRTGVSFAGLDAPIRRLMVTSAGKGEGKSTTAVNLATAMAQDGKRVILLDADMRAPTVHRFLDFDKAPGLADVLAGLKSVEEVLRTTRVDNLLLIPAGSVPPNPAELLGTPAFDAVLAQLDQQADVVIVDTPPCVLVTDPLIVAARMDAVLLVLQVGYSRKAGIKQMVEMLGRARARIIGLTFNKEPLHKRGYYYYRRYHYYGYGPYTEVTLREDQYRRNGTERKPDRQNGTALTTHRSGTDEEPEA